MPLPPEDAVEAAEAGQDPEFEFTKVECLLLAYHKVGRQVPQHLTEDEKTLSDFRVRADCNVSESQCWELAVLPEKTHLLRLWCQGLHQEAE